ncbi:odorant receptor 33b [Diachasma alloeum]|uniref:Odorant receptor n=1 Tax=Diachasma alloeum TaxID=454923 RepID=A0A4E0RSS1_9HYME|nr:odorant receptor 33b [Diachasma alloeum]THK32987.1 odorant receptor 120 [Diachasma alloeum]
MGMKTIFSIDQSYLYFNFKCMTLMGLWNPYEIGVKYWLYQIYTMWMIGVIHIMRTMSTFSRSLTADTPLFFIQESSIFAAEIADIIKCIAFIYHRVQISELSNLFNWEKHMLSGEELKNRRNQVLRDSLFASKTFTIVIMISGIQYFAFYFYSALMQSDHQVERLPMGSIPMKYLIVSTKFWPVFIVDYLSATALGVIALSQDAFLMGVMINIAAQLKILNLRLEYRQASHKSNDNYSSNHPNLGTHFDCVVRIHDKPATLEPNDELIICIKFHQQIMRMLKLFKSIYSIVLLPQIFISLSMTVLQLQLILGEHQKSTDTLIASVFLFGVVVQLLAFCWGGNFILMESEKTSYSIYASHWYSEDRVFRNNLKIFLGAVRNPLTVTAGGLIGLTAETFKNILSKGYSVAAVLKNFN